MFDENEKRTNSNICIFQNGMRRRHYNVLSGSIFAIWTRIEAQIRAKKDVGAIRVIRLKTVDGERIVGVLVPNEAVDDLIADLSNDSEEQKEQIFLKE